MLPQSNRPKQQAENLDAAPAKPDAKAPEEQAKFKTVDDILTEDHKGFRDPKLNAAYRDYYATKIRQGAEPVSPEEWARRQTTGEPRKALERELGPDYARTRRNFESNSSRRYSATGQLRRRAFAARSSEADVASG